MAKHKYKVVCNGSMLGQHIMNTFYYQSIFELLDDDLPFAGAMGVATNFKQEVWDTAWRGLVSSDYSLTNITVTPLTTDFKPIYTMPYVLSVSEAGGGSSENFGARACVNIHFNLKSQGILEGVSAPKRGYVAIAGLEKDHAEDGKLKQTFWADPTAAYGKLAEKFTENLQELNGLTVWQPIRARQAEVIGTNLAMWTGVAEIVGASVDPVVSFRRSRKQS